MVISKQLESFLDLIDSIDTKYRFAFEQVNACDKLTQDLLHRLELDKPAKGEKDKIATQLKHCRQDRRYWKDITEELEALYNIFYKEGSKPGELSQNRLCLNRMKEALGKTRKVEAYHETRTYKPRIFKPV